MKKIILILVLSVILQRPPCLAGQTVLVLDGIDIPYFMAAFDGFKRACMYDIKHLDDSPLNRTAILQYINEEQPDVIYLRGNQALKKVLGVTEIPVLYSMVLHPEEFIGARPNFTGVQVKIPEETKFEIMRIAIPDAERVGMIYSARTSAKMKAETRQAAAKFGFKIVSRKLYDLENFPNVIKGFRRIDMFLMAPDWSVYQDGTVEPFFQHTGEKMIPVVCHNPEFLLMGAFLSIHPDPRAMGFQAGLMANRIIKGADVAALAPEPPADVYIEVNLKMTKRIGLEINDALHRLIKKGKWEKE